MKIIALALSFILALLFLAVAGTVHFGTVQAESSITKPSVPEFTVKFVNASYVVTTTNPYTGLSETKLTNNNSIEVTIKNQPFDYSNNQIYYNIRTKPHFASNNNWTEIYPLRNLTSSYTGNNTWSYAEYINPDSPAQSSSSYTIVAFPVPPTDYYGESGYDVQRFYSGDEGQEGRYFAFLHGIPNGAEIDFQVETLVGHAAQSWYIDHPFYPTIGGHFAPAVAYDATSDWTNTQTITITTPTSSPTSSPSPTPTLDQEPQQTEPSPTAFVIAVSGASVAVIGAGFIVYFKKRKH